MTDSPHFTRKRIRKDLSLGLLVCCGGFEDRALTFVSRLTKARATADRAELLQYQSQREDNDGNFKRLRTMLNDVTLGEVHTIQVDASRPVRSFEHIRARIVEVAAAITRRKVTVDISGMTHMWALGVIHACIVNGLEVEVVYTEADKYFPLRKDAQPLVEAWRNKDYDKAEGFLQSAALMAVNIPPDFAGNFRPGSPCCLVVFAGCEPNRLEGLVDSYAPGALVVVYGVPPREKHQWRKDLSQRLHEQMFSNWPRRVEQCSTLDPEETVCMLEKVFSVVGHQYDMAIAPHCSKMQGIAAYVFWRRHPETQLIFTAPARFKPSQYSQGERGVYLYRLSAALRGR